MTNPTHGWIFFLINFENSLGTFVLFMNVLCMCFSARKISKNVSFFFDSEKKQVGGGGDFFFFHGTNLFEDRFLLEFMLGIGTKLCWKVLILNGCIIPIVVVSTNDSIVLLVWERIGASLSLPYISGPKSSLSPHPSINHPRRFSVMLGQLGFYPS